LDRLCKRRGDKIIYVNGDSWSQRSNINPDYSWPCLLQEKINCPVLNQSAGCGSNSRMLSNLYRLYQSGAEPKIVLIGLTTYTRWHLPARLGSSWSIGPTVINDRFSKPNESMLPFYVNDVFDDLEYVYQFYNQIWQMQEIAKNYLKCPIIFFVGWTANSPTILDIHHALFKGNLEDWVCSKVEDTQDYAVQDYINAFQFFKTKVDDWHLVLDTWSDLVYNNIDDDNGLHPGHPNPQGHKIICQNVLDKIKEKFPTIYKELL
jgi:hypothetical protein